MMTFCTLFDSTYMSRGMAMYRSLCRQCNNFHLYIFAFDDYCYNFFSSNDFEHVTVISLQEFEDQRLLVAKKNRSSGEYCWTCTPSTVLYVLDHFEVDNCTYIDADLFFYSSPQVLIDEVGDDSVMITEHRYTEKYDQTKTSGKYCVQFVFFKNDKRARKVLEWWREACLEWCYNRQEEGRFGDQKYLDDWCTRFEGVHELQHLGGGVAPWNMQQYTFINKRGKVYGIESSTKRVFNIVFYHFHGSFFLSPIFFLFAAGYDKNIKGVFRSFFIPYNIEILRIRKKYPAINQKEKYEKKKEWLPYSRFEKKCCLWSLGIMNLCFGKT